MSSFSSSPVSTLPEIDTSLYKPFLDHGFRRQRLALPKRESDPTLQLCIHSLSREASTSPSSSSSISTLILLHGHPQSALIWHRIVPLLPKSVRIIVPDLRGHGLSDAPSIGRKEDGSYETEAMAARYSKREMARDIVETVKLLGGQEDGRWAIVGHDRGGRVAHRLALDHPQLLNHVMLLDIAPTTDMYKKTEARFATAYWHWFFLIQPHPFPEEMILANPTAYLEKLTSRFPNSAVRPSSFPSPRRALHPPEILASYRAALSTPAHVQATCEDYRCSAPGGSDWNLDEASVEAGEKIKPRVRVLWGSRGVVEKMYAREGVLKMWRDRCADFDEEASKALPAGHYLPEEVPEEIVAEIKDFLTL